MRHLNQIKIIGTLLFKGKLFTVRNIVDKVVSTKKNTIWSFIISYGNLSFTEKKAIIKRVVTKIVATKQEVKIWGRIPLLATPEGETINNNESSIFANHLLNERKVGLDVINRYCWDATIPFKLTFKMPPTDRGKRGYSDKYVEELAKIL